MPSSNKNPVITAEDIEFGGLMHYSDARALVVRKSVSLSFSGDGYLPIKRAIDIVLGIFLAILTLPVLAGCAILTKIDSPGPVFFKQRRTGKGGRRFEMFKLRTMVEDAELSKQKYAHLNVQGYPDFKIPNDPRITRVGRFLRKTSLDELPQIFNVILGDMSLVGHLEF